MTKPEPKLTHMPEHIKQMIADLSTTDMGTKLSLGLVCHEFRDHAEKSPTNYAGVSINLYSRKVTVRIWAIFKKPDDSNYEKHIDMEFSAQKDGVLKKNPTSGWEKILPGDDYRKAAVQYYIGIMGRAKTTIDNFYLGIGIWGERETEYLETKFEEDRSVIMDEMERILSGLGRPLNVKYLKCNVQLTDTQMLQLLPYLKAGKLREIQFSINVGTPTNPPLNLDLISETEQWKQAKKLDIYRYDCSISFEKLFHFEEVDGSLTIASASPVSAKTIVETFINHPTMRNLIVQCVLDDEDEVITEFAEYLQLFGVNFSDFEQTEVFIPSEPDTYIDIAFQRNIIIVSRIPRNSYQL